MISAALFVTAVFLLWRGLKRLAHATQPPNLFLGVAYLVASGAVDVFRPPPTHPYDFAAAGAIAVFITARLLGRS